MIPNMTFRMTVVVVVVVVVAVFTALSSSTTWQDVTVLVPPVVPMVVTASTTTTTTTITTMSRTRMMMSSTRMRMMIPRGGGGGRVIRTTTTTTTRSPSRQSSPSTPIIGTATISNEVLNLVKGIVGVGVLSLPAGISHFGNHPSALLPALILIASMGLLSGYGFAIIGTVCHYTQATSYKEAWSKSIHPRTAWIPALSSTCKTFLACLALSMVLGDTLVGLFQLPTSMRTTVLITLTTVILLPLCWMKNLSALSPFSLLGILGMVFTGVAMTKRYFDQSYVGPHGIYFTQISTHLQPNFGNDGYMSVFQPRALILLCMLSTAYMAHFNAPKFYNELVNRTLPRFYTVVAWSFGISILMIGYITAMGFLTFGSAASGLVLNNYSPHDVWMSTSRIAVVVALIFSYPLAFQGCRDGILDVVQLVQPKVSKTPATLNVLTMVLLVLLTTLAATLKDVSFVLALGGGTLCCSV